MMKKPFAVPPSAQRRQTTPREGFDIVKFINSPTSRIRGA